MESYIFKVYQELSILYYFNLILNGNGELHLENTNYLDFKQNSLDHGKYVGICCSTDNGLALQYSK